MKRWLKILGAMGAVLVLLVVAAVVLPFVVDFNRFKPQIQAAVAEQVNAKLDFESAQLTLLTGLGVKLTKVSLENTDPKFAGTRLFAVDELVFRTELWPLFEKKFVGYVNIDRPEIVVVRSGLASNITSLSKPKQPESAGTTQDPQAPSEKPLTPEEQAARRAQIEELKKNIVVKSLHIEKASLTLKDVGQSGASEPVRVRDLDLDVTNIGVDRPVRAILTTQANVNQPGLRVNGPVELLLNFTVLSDGSTWKEATYDGRLTLDKMFISAANGAFSKSEQIPLGAEFAGKAFPDAFEASKLKLRLHNLDVDVTARIDGFERKDAKVTVKAQSADLAKLGDVLPQHKNFLLNASVDLDAGIEGALATPEKVKSRLALKTVLTGSDLDLNWSSDHMKPLNGTLQATSKRLDLTSLMAPFTGATQGPYGEKSADNKETGGAAPAGGTASPSATAGNGSGDGAGNATAAEEFALTSEQKEMLAGGDVQAKIQVGELLYKEFRIENLLLDANLQGFVARLRELSLSAFGGRTKIDGLVNLSTVPLGFKSKIDLDGVLVEQVLAFAVPEHKDVLEGKADLNLDVEGRGSTFPNISKTLDGKGTFAFAEGELKTQSVAALGQQKFDAFVANLSVVKAADDIIVAAEKIVANPLVKSTGALKDIDIAKYKREYDAVRNVRISEKASRDRTIKDVKGTLEIRKGRIYLSSKNGGRDGELDFNGSVGLDLSLQGNALYTAGEPVKQKMLAQTKYASLLFDDGGKLTLPMVLGGTVKSPEVKIDFAPLEARFTTKARAVAETELRKKAEDELNALLKKNGQVQLDELKKKVNEEKKRLQERAKSEIQKATGKDPKKLLKGILGK